jgi:hypothetical protein
VLPPLELLEVPPPPLLDVLPPLELLEVPPPLLDVLPPLELLEVPPPLLDVLPPLELLEVLPPLLLEPDELELPPLPRTSLLEFSVTCVAFPQAIKSEAENPSVSRRQLAFIMLIIMWLMPNYHALSYDAKCLLLRTTHVRISDEALARIAIQHNVASGRFRVAPTINIDRRSVHEDNHRSQQDRINRLAKSSFHNPLLLDREQDIHRQSAHR